MGLLISNNRITDIQAYYPRAVVLQVQFLNRDPWSAKYIDDKQQQWWTLDVEISRMSASTIVWIVPKDVQVLVLEYYNVTTVLSYTVRYH